jgi:hypothetical protein
MVPSPLERELEGPAELSPTSIAKECRNYSAYIYFYFFYYVKIEHLLTAG